MDERDTPRVCEQCGATYTRPSKQGRDWFAHSRFCSIACRLARQTGPVHPDIPTGLVSPAMLGITPDQHAILPGGHALARHLYEDAEAFARCWLNARAQRAA